MLNRQVLLASALAVMLAALGGCAAYQKCGANGCEGDAKITSDVKTQFAREPTLVMLKVQTVDHVVYLYGLVDTDLQRETAEDLAAGVPGVTRVVNSIGISGNK